MTPPLLLLVVQMMICILAEGIRKLIWIITKKKKYFGFLGNTVFIHTIQIIKLRQKRPSNLPKVTQLAGGGADI